MRTVASLAQTAALVLLAGSAGAQDLAAELAAAQRLFAAARHVESLERLEEAMQVVNAAMPLTVRTAVIVEEATAYGAYVPRGSNAFGPDDKVRLYIEPLGYGFRRNGDLYEAELVGDFALKTPTGHTLLAQKDFARFPVSSRRRNREFFLSVTYAYSIAKPGDYVIVTTLRDLVSGKSTSVETPIKVTDGAPGAGKEAPRRPN